MEHDDGQSFAVTESSIFDTPAIHAEVAILIHGTEARESGGRRATAAEIMLCRE
jgi:hypothetical protein